MASPNSKTLTLKPSASTSFTEERLREYNRRRQASSSSNPYLYLRSLGLSPGRESFASSARTSASSSSVLLMIQEWTPSCLLLLHCFEITVVSLSLSLSLSLFLRQIRMNLGVSGEINEYNNFPRKQSAVREGVSLLLELIDTYDGMMVPASRKKPDFDPVITALLDPIIQACMMVGLKGIVPRR
ncbi:uncharacterized protein LOC109832700 isoform X1 [Asparagus officinalis]|uniref:uncharacterized protein LOC109832700 isoform X1 n=1 Tax=Asparagus officinalis TaxID=4686 RepID=UPI00098E2C7D|nr:uncharacterized protein LOC109832700 isoform X1 [Asparagus officinalis]